MTAVNMPNLRTGKLLSSVLALACILLGSCHPRQGHLVTRITIAVDSHSGVDDWIFQQIVRFNELGEVDGLGNRIEASIALKENFFDLLKAERLPAQIVVLAYGIDDAMARNLMFHPQSGIPLAKVRLAIDGPPGASLPHSVKQTLALLRANRIKLKYDNPTQHATGVATLVLLAYADRAFEDDELTKIKEERMMQLLRHIRDNGSVSSQSNPLATGEVSIASGADMSKAATNCSYPHDITAELDYRAYLVKGLSDNQVGVAKKFLAFLTSHPLGTGCPGQESQMIVNTGAVSAKDSVVRLWQSVN